MQKLRSSEAGVKKDRVISSTWIVWSLSRAGDAYRCSNCGGRMFVRYDSGLCPWCWNGRTPHLGPAVEVPHERVLAGVLDDPAVEV